MKKVIKTSILLFTFISSAHHTRAQLASDKPLDKAPVTAPVATAAKVIPPVTASSTTVATLPTTKKSAKVSIADPTASQGKEMAQPVAPSPAQLPVVSTQGVSPAKS